MLKSLPTEEDKTGGIRNMVLPMHTEKSMDGAGMQQESLKVDLKERKFLLRTRKQRVVRQERLEKVILIRYIEGK